MGNAMANVAVDARPAHAHKRRAEDDDVVPGGGDAAWPAKRRRTTVPVWMELLDTMLVAGIDIDAHAPAAGGDLRPATRTTTTTRAARAKRARIPDTPGREWRATPLDFDAPAASLPLPPRGMPLDLDWPATPLNLDWPPQSTATPLERGPQCADYASAFDPELVAAYEDNRPDRSFREELQVYPAAAAEDAGAPLVLAEPILCAYDRRADIPADDAVNIDSQCAPVPTQMYEHDDRKPHGPLHEDSDIVPALQRLDGWESPVPLNLGAHTPPLIAVPYAPRGAGNVDPVLALEDDERKPYVPFHEKFDFITAWQRDVASPPDACYRPDASSGIPLGDPRTRDWVLLPDNAAPYDVPPMSPKTRQGFADFLAALPPGAYDWAVPSAFDEVEPAGPRARVEMGLLTPEDEVQGGAGGAVDADLLTELLLDVLAQR